MYCGYIIELNGVHKHPNADRLQCATVFGNNVIFDLSYHEGQKCVFFPVDGQLDKDFAMNNNLLQVQDETGKNIGGYMDPKKRNIKAIRLRGERSEGLILPIEVLQPYTDINKLQVGEQISVLGGTEICTKFIPEKKSVISGGCSGNFKGIKSKEAKERFPFFEEHIDTAQLMYNQTAFKPGDRCIITLKMHGTSGRTANSLELVESKAKWYQKLFKRKPEEIRKWTVVSGSRRRVIKDFKIDSGYYNTNDFRKKYHDFFSAWLAKGEEIYYEIVGYANESTPIMGSVSTSKIQDKELKKFYGDTMEFSYGCERGKSDAYVYRMTMTNEDGHVVEYPDWLMRIRCEQMGIKCVPKFEEFTFTTWEDLMSRVEKYYDGTDPIGKTHIREGVVVRIENRQKFTAYKHKNFTFKLVSGIISETINTENMSEDELSEL